MKSLFVFLFSLFFTQLTSYPVYQEYPDQLLKGEGAYLEYVDKIKKYEIKTIFEIGSRDAKDAIELSRFFQCHVFAFECNPVALDLCKKNIDSNPNVTLIPLAVWDKSGPLSFYRVVEGNIGASSCFPFNPQAKNYPEIIEEGLIQEKMVVKATRLDEFLKANHIASIDLLCMDVQGASFQVLKSLGRNLAKVKYIITELETHPIYKNEILYKDVDKFLRQRGFVRVSDPLDKHGLFGDVLYVNSNLEKRETSFWLKLKSLFSNIGLYRG